MIALWSFPLWAAEAAFPSSPPISIDDTETVEKHHLELNLTLGFSGKAGAWESEAPLIDGNYGLSDNVHINAEIPYTFGQSEGQWTQGLGDAAIAIKYRFVHQEQFAWAIHPELAFSPMGEGHLAFTLPIVMNVAIGNKGLGMGLQVSHTFQADADSWGAALGLSHPLGEKGAWMVDYSQEAEGWLEVGYVRDEIFGMPAWTLLSSVGRSTQGNTSALLGLQFAK